MKQPPVGCALRIRNRKCREQKQQNERPSRPGRSNGLTAGWAALWRCRAGWFFRCQLLGRRPWRPGGRQGVRGLSRMADPITSTSNCTRISATRFSWLMQRATFGRAVMFPAEVSLTRRTRSGCKGARLTWWLGMGQTVRCHGQQAGSGRSLRASGDGDDRQVQLRRDRSRLGIPGYQTRNHRFRTTGSPLSKTAR